MGHPVITVVVPSTNSAPFVEQALQSLAEQDYPALDAIVLVSEPKDRAAEIAKGYVYRYPRLFRIEVEGSRCFGQALCNGFARARGEILGYLHPDDVLMPAVLPQVAKALRAADSQSAVLGRSLFIVEGMEGASVLRPIGYPGRFEQLAIWRGGIGNLPSQPVFWRRSSFADLGNFEFEDRLIVEFEIICRLAKNSKIKNMNKIWNACRIYEGCVFSGVAQAEALVKCIAVSRRYWGSLIDPLRWRCEAAYWLYGHHSHEQARHHARQVEASAKARKWGEVAAGIAKTFVTSPEMALRRFRSR
jgi:glycosyltransferase involved in cell wall biosynthesis